MWITVLGKKIRSESRAETIVISTKAYSWGTNMCNDNINRKIVLWNVSFSGFFAPDIDNFPWKNNLFRAEGRNDFYINHGVHGEKSVKNYRRILDKNHCTAL